MIGDLPDETPPQPHNPHNIGMMMNHWFRDTGGATTNFGTGTCERGRKVGVGIGRWRAPRGGGDMTDVTVLPERNLCPVQHPYGAFASQRRRHLRCVTIEVCDR